MYSISLQAVVLAGRVGERCTALAGTSAQLYRMGVDYMCGTDNNSKHITQQ